MNLRLGGAPARIQVPGPAAPAAIAAAAARLDRQIRRLTRGCEPWPWPDPERRPLAAAGQGRIVRVKTFRLHTGVPCQATAAMNAMDYDAYLFTDAETGEDAIVHRARADRDAAGPPTQHAPCVDVGDGAVDHQSAQNPGAHTGPCRATAGRILAAVPALHRPRQRTREPIYRRYDGNLALIRPAESSSDA